HYGVVCVLLTGDIGQEAEQSIAADLQVAGHSCLTVLKAPHHGSATSSTRAFLEAVRPRAVVISVGQGNRHGHPAQAVLERYQRQEVMLFRTDTDGQVTLTSDGRMVEIKTAAGKVWRLDRH
ncbi:MAG: ComEC/Rec2 family competence protein, partial [Acidimicrobiia bacterium]